MRTVPSEKQILVQYIDQDKNVVGEEILLVKEPVQSVDLAFATPSVLSVWVCFGRFSPLASPCEAGPGAVRFITGFAGMVQLCFPLLFSFFAKKLEKVLLSERKTENTVYSTHIK